MKKITIAFAAFVLFSLQANTASACVIPNHFPYVSTYGAPAYAFIRSSNSGTACFFVSWTDQTTQQFAPYGVPTAPWVGYDYDWKVPFWASRLETAVYYFALNYLEELHCHHTVSTLVEPDTTGANYNWFPQDDCFLPSLYL